jgi:membrane fusion protein, multidrug efflux system
MKFGTAKKMILGMALMLLIAGLLFGSIFGYKSYQSRTGMKAMALRKMPPATVTAVKAGFQTWRPELRAAGSLRAVRGIDVTGEIAGLVRSVEFRPGEEVEEGRILVQLNADADIAQLRSLEAAAELAEVVYERDRKQYDAQAVSRAVLDADEADLKTKRAQVAQQAAIVEKKTIRTPFAGRLGISIVNPGQYLNPGDRIVTLQSLDPLYIDFFLPQQELSQVSLGHPVLAAIDAYPGQTFSGRITTINPKVEVESRNVQVESTFENPGHRLLPGMFASVRVQAGAAKRYLTLPQTAVSYNPYGETVYIIESAGNGPDGKPILSVKLTFVVVGPTRGDQVAILSGIKEGESVVTSGQLKLKTGSSVVIDNRAQPANNAAPRPVDQ